MQPELSYHGCNCIGWTYDLSGRLTSATQLKGIKIFRNPEMSLIPIALAQFGPLLFLNFSKDCKLDKNGQTNNNSQLIANSADLRGFLGEAGDQLHREGVIDPYAAEVACSPSKYVFVKRRSYVMKCNWKAFADNYLDGGYHVPFAH